ncbi:DNA polymerase family A-domain-containing protein [Linnemannia elongata]|nr:DNA polymerase family A-domain-containing protein [Linnemannia elongata]
MVHRLVSRHPWRQHHHTTRTTTATVTSTGTSRHHFYSILSSTSFSSSSSETIRPTRVLLTAALVNAHHHACAAPTSSRLASYLPSARHVRLLSTLTDLQLRKNKVDVQMLHPELHSKVFPTSKTIASSLPSSSLATTKLNTSMEPTADMVKYAIGHLEKQNLWGKEAIPVPNTTFPVPPLRGPTIEDHFYNIGKLDSERYQELASTFAQSPVHSPPETWIFQEGWTRYGKDGSVMRVEYPKEKMFTFDVETVPSLSKYPVMACAISPEAWYGWVSPWLINPLTKDGRQNDSHLLSFGPSQNRKGDERILVGHNVGYDRARVLEEYCLEQNGMRYLDTMSLHIAASGLCTQQRPGWLKYSKAVENSDSAYVDAFKDTTGKYFDVSAVNSLLQVAKFHCGINMDKAPRNILVEATDIGLIQENFQELMTYCGQDVVATHAVYQQTFPKYLETCPHPVSFSGMLQMGSSFLTVNEGWTAYVARCNKMYKEMAENVESKLMLLAQNALDNFEKNPEYYQNDPWLSQLDWSMPKKRMREGTPRVDGKGWVKGKEPKEICQTRLLPDKPQWYRGLWNLEEKRVKLTTRQRVAPLLLKLQWRGFPLVHSQLHGWTFRVPKEDAYTTKLAELTFPAEGEAGFQVGVNITDYRYYRLPHKFGEGINVGNPLAKGYISYFEDNVLSSFAGEGEGSIEDGSSQLARQALDMNAQCAYWVSARERIEDQFVVWDKGADGLGEKMKLPEREGEGKTNGIILPQIITMGTVTRRAVEKTWMTASNAKKNRIGSELKSNVEAPAGYKIVGADVDSEELWISSLMGDAQFRMHGATALGWMTLQGTKAAGTDLHSKTANILGISRDQAKIFNYGRIYGAGVKFAARLMQQFNSTIDAAEAKQRATNLYTATKGLKQLKAPEYELVHDRPFWHGGSESYMFNSLERTATADDPRTPALGCGITDALKPKHTESQFMTSRVNWVVQSSGVDYLHMLLVSMNYLIKKYDIKARFMLCVHDEVRYMVKEEDSARATLALQVSNLWTRAMFSYKLGIHDLPQSVAFFSSVDVDHVFRKEVNMDCLTPTQPHPISHGQSLTIEGVLDLTDGGQLGPVAPGFEDAAEDSIPFALLSKDRQQQILMQQAQQNSPIIQEITEEQGEVNGLVKTAAQNAEERNSIFLQAQSLATMKEIKLAIKTRQAEAEAAYKAQVEAERKRLEDAERASRGDQGDDGSGQGGEVVKAVATKRKSTITAPKPRKTRIVREAAPYAFKPKSTKGSWGRVMSDEELRAELAETQEREQQQQQQQSSGPTVVKEILQEAVVKSEVEEAFPFVDDGTPEDAGFAAAYEDVVSDETLATVSLDDDWTRQSKEWLHDFTKDYTSDSQSLDFDHASADSGLPFESGHLPWIPPSADDITRETSTLYDAPDAFIVDSLSSFVTSRRSNASHAGPGSGSARTTSSSTGAVTAAAAAAAGRISKPTATTTTHTSSAFSYSNSRSNANYRSQAAPAPTPALASTSTTTTSRPRSNTSTYKSSARVDVRSYGEFQEIYRQQKTRATNVDTAAMRGSAGSGHRRVRSFTPATGLSIREIIPCTSDADSAAAATTGAGEGRGRGGDGSDTTSASSPSSSRSSSRSSSWSSSSASRTTSSAQTTSGQASQSRIFSNSR